jgi:hypothetical protein
MYEALATIATMTTLSPLNTISTPVILLECLHKTERMSMIKNAGSPNPIKLTTDPRIPFNFKPIWAVMARPPKPVSPVQ